MAWENEVRAMKTPVLIISGDADVATLEHYVRMFRLLGGGVMGDMGKPLPASRIVETRLIASLLRMRGYHTDRFAA